MDTRVLVKEGRPLFWPWCAVMLSGFVSLIRPLHSIEWIGLLGIVLGIPLLATLPFGNEFQNRTLSLLLSQPVGRARIWIEKSSVAFVAVGSAVLLFAFSPLAAETLPYRGQELNAAALILAVLASATFWTLIARSTVGGIALSVGAALLIAASVSVATGVVRTSLFMATHFTSISVAPMFCYAALMLWLGARRLARYQVTGPVSGDDLFTTGSNVLLGAFSNRACCNPDRPVLNLIRKEFHLLRPIWLITVLTASPWACFALVELLRQKTAAKGLSLATIAIGISCTLIVSILAGCLSLGDEKTSGTYAWHRTLPISPMRQWATKLSVALFVSLVCAGFVPVLLVIGGRHFFPSAFSSENISFQVVWLLAALSLTLFSFWCACAVNGTVTAVVWAVPILAVVTLAPQIGNGAAFRLVGFLVSKFGLFANFRLAVFLSSLINPQNFNEIVNRGASSAESLFFCIPSLILAVIQSYRLFRAPIQDSILSVARKLLSLVVVAFLWSASAYGFLWLSNEASAQIFYPMFTVNRGVQAFLSNGANREATQPLRLTFEDLNKLSAGKDWFPRKTPGWLEDASITVIPDKAHPTTCCAVGGLRATSLWNYTAIIHLTSGADVTLSMEPPKDQPLGPPKWNQSVRWPGETRDEPLHYWL